MVCVPSAISKKRKLKLNRNLTFIDRLFLCLRSRCPVCTKGRLFNSLWRINTLNEIFLPVRTCPNCGFRFEREAGYYFGCVFPILPILSLFPAIIFAAVSYFYFKMEPNEVAFSAVLGALFGFIIFFRLSVAIYIAIDHSISADESFR